MSADGVFNNPGELNGLTAYDRDGDKIGNVGQVYVDDRTGRAEWVTVKTGLFGMKESLVPLSGARRTGEGLHVAHPKETVKDAPRLDADEHLDAAQERELYEHYGLTGAGAGMSSGMAGAKGTDTTKDTGGTTGTGMAAGAGAGAAGGVAGGVDAGTSTGRGAGTAKSEGVGMGFADADMTGTGDHRKGEELIRSEEQLHVGTEEHESGRARLRKVVVTENITTTVPVSHEEVRVIHEPITDGDRTKGRIGEAETQVTLHAEQPVVRKETVAVERVRMETEKVTEQQEVSSEVRKEQIEYDSGQEGDEMGGKDMGGKRGPRH